MNCFLRCGLLIGGLILWLACGTEQPTAPSVVLAPRTTTPQPAPPPTPPPQLPSGEPSAIYVYSGPLDYAVSGFTTGSQYLLYDNGVFGLRYDAFANVYLGTYQQDGATITFGFGHGIATGTLKGDLLEVRYNDIMQHSDFENAVYRRIPLNTT